MVLSSSPDKTHRHPRIFHLERSGTVLAKSSNFTRASAILHATDVVVGVDGAHDKGGATHVATAGVEFVSALSKLDTLFHRNTSRPGTTPPPPPPPPPKLPEVRFFTETQTASSQIVSSPLQPSEAKATVIEQKASNSSRTEDNGKVGIRRQMTNSLPHPFHKPPPLEGMFTSAPTRHLKLIKTKLTDLPNGISRHEPQIRGGIAIYKVTDPADREMYGAMVEISAIDYIEELRTTIRGLERSTSILRGKLENLERERTPQLKESTRTTLRMGTLLGRRTKGPEPESGDKIIKSITPAKINSGNSRITQRSLVKPHSDSIHPRLQSKESLSVETKRARTIGQGGRKRSSETSGSSTGKSSKVPSTSRTPRKYEPQAGLRKATQISSSSLPTDIREYHRHPDGSHKEGKGKRQSIRSKTVYEKNSLLAHRVQRKSSTEDNNDHPQRHLSEPLPSRPSVRPASKWTKEQICRDQGKGAQRSDRTSPSMILIPRKTDKPKRLSRTQSFVGTTGNSSKKAVAHSIQADKVSRTLSLHRESNATPPENNKAKSISKTRAVLRLFGVL